jgi:DnaJ domain
MAQAATEQSMDDPYAVLGVGRSATLEEIQAAYRRKAMSAHPDRGGSHDAMVAATMAWEILRDPQRRAAYDRQRATPSDLALHAAWESAARQARSTAEKYPQKWAEFQKWVLSSVGNDLRNTKYEWTQADPNPGLLRMPRLLVPNSLSGVMFGIAGVFFVITLFVWLNWEKLCELWQPRLFDGQRELFSSNNILAIPFRLIWLFALGWCAFVGLHMGLGALIKEGFARPKTLQLPKSAKKSPKARELVTVIGTAIAGLILICLFGSWLFYIPESADEATLRKNAELQRRMAHYPEAQRLYLEMLKRSTKEPAKSSNAATTPATRP